ncbi:MAG TPA: sugar transferase [Gemmatimonadaceae bacterium]|nr:sugar transferase [Gemmatimonadaceae bacterium]
MYPVLKRALDVIIALSGLILLSPVLLGIAIWVKATSAGPVFYSGTRVGKDGVLFPMLKFRTMVVNADKIGASSTSADDSRLTSTGRFLRRFKLDELPQLINVLRGEMSFVGPRPQVEWAVKLYTAEERELLSVRPGVTDFASLQFRNEAEILRGSADPDRDYLEKIAPAKIRLGLFYVRNYSFSMDASIFAATILSIAGVDPSWCLRPVAAYADPPALSS